MMILTWSVPATIPKETLDALNRTSDEIHTRVMQLHRAIYNHTGVWLSCELAEKLDDALNQKRPCPLHSHSIDAAQQAFYKAAKTTRTVCKTDRDARFPYKCKYFRTTAFKSTA